MKKFKKFLIEDPIIGSAGGLQPLNPYGPTNLSSPYLNMNQYLSSPMNPTGEAPLYPYMFAAGSARTGSEVFDEYGHKRSLNRPTAKPKAPPTEQFDPNDPFWQTDLGRWVLTELANMIRHWNDQQWWSENSTYSFENRYDALQNFLRGISNMIVGGTEGHPIYPPALPNVQGDSSWLNSFEWFDWGGGDNWNNVGPDPNTNQSSNAF
jgi:hypothetical protein